MSAIRTKALTLYGQQIDQQQVAIGETVLWTLTLQDPTTRDPVDLTGGNVIMSVVELDAGAPVYPPIIPRQADISVPATAGICTVPWAIEDTVPDGVPIDAGLYGIDVWTTDGDGNRLQNMGFGVIRFTAPATLPDVEIVPLPSQLPLAQGPAGLTWRGVYNGATAYVETDAVYYTSGLITSSYRAIASTTGNVPTNATYWEPIALGGGGSGTGTVTTVTSSTTALTVTNPTTTPALAIADAVAGGASGLMTGADKTKADATSTDAQFIAAQHTYGASQNVAAVALTDAATIATNAALGNVFTVTLGGNRTLANPTNLVSGGTYIWIVTQSTGSHTLAFGSAFKWPSGVAPTLSTAAGAVDMISSVYNGSILISVATLDVS